VGEPHESFEDLGAHQGSGSLHKPVLYQEVLDGLAIRPGGKYVDCTTGMGGHAIGMLERSSPGGRLLALDVDPLALDVARKRLAPFAGRVTLVQTNFTNLLSVARSQGFAEVDGILMDLGWSSWQLADGSRGFSFRATGPLDMRYDPTLPETASDLVNRLPERELADLLWRFGEERRSRAIARAIVRHRPIHTAIDLAGVVSRATGGKRGRRIHPATKTFQALRIAVNHELDVLRTTLPQAVALLRVGGRLAVISFHSLEDRIVKNYIRQEERDCICPIEQIVCSCGHRAVLRRVTRKPIVPGVDEVQRNPRSRSAKLRIAERL